MTYDESNDDDLVLTGSDISIESSTSAKPVLTLFNSNADANGSTIKLNKNGSSPATNDVVGNLDFISEDSGNNVTTYGRIQSTIVDVTSGGEEGSIDFYVAENDGTLTKGMEIKGLASDADVTVDISAHDGTAGGLKLGGTLVTAEAAELNILDASNVTSISSNADASNGDISSNNYKISHTLTLNGALANGSEHADITISNSKVLATSVIIANCSVNANIDVHTVVNGSFKIRITNKSGGDLLDDSTMIINYRVI